MQEVVLIAEELGVDGAALAEAVTRDDVKQRVKDKTAEAIDGEPFFGSDRIWQIERFLGKE